jgi:FHA domain
MTGTMPPGEGEQTQPMAAPPSLSKAPARARSSHDLGGQVVGGPAAGGLAEGGPDASGPAAGGPAVGGLAVDGPYADMDTIDEPDAAALATRAGAGPARVAAKDPSGAGRTAPAASAARGTGGGRPAAPPPGSGGSALAWLWGEQGQAGEYLLASRSVTVGRDPGSDIVLHDRTVSREHARFEYDGGQWWLLPAGAAGPTWVNGQPLAPGQRRQVTDGDRLRFGFHTQLRLLVPGARG